MVKILVVEDNIEISKNIEEYFKKEFEITAVYNGADALDNLQIYNYDVVILDLMLPEVGGMTVLKYISDKCLNTGVIILTAKEELGDKLKAFNLGANDYLTKPFGLSELSARVDSLIRRFTTLGGQDTTINELSYGNIHIDLIKRIVIKNGNEVILTAKEFELISFLASHPEHVFSKKQIYQQVWQDDYIYNDNNIMALIRRTRKKIEDDPDNPVLIQTAWGVGYRFHWEGN